MDIKIVNLMKLYQKSSSTLNKNKQPKHLVMSMVFKILINAWSSNFYALLKVSCDLYLKTNLWSVLISQSSSVYLIS